MFNDNIDYPPLPTPCTPIVYVASPFAGDIDQNTENARQYCRFAVSKGYLPLAPHLHFPQFLDENDPKERKLGLQFALILLDKCDELWVFGNRISEGMSREIDHATVIGIPIRYIDSNCEVKSYDP